MQNHACYFSGTLQITHFVAASTSATMTFMVSNAEQIVHPSPEPADPLANASLPEPPRNLAVILCRNAVLEKRESMKSAVLAEQNAQLAAQKLLPIFDRIASGTLTHLEAIALIQQRTEETSIAAKTLIASVEKQISSERGKSDAARIKLTVDAGFAQTILETLLPGEHQIQKDVQSGIACIPQLSTEELTLLLRNALSVQQHTKFSHKVWNKDVVIKLLELTSLDHLCEAVETLQAEAINQLKGSGTLRQYDEKWSPALPWIYLSPEGKDTCTEKTVRNYRRGDIYYTRGQTFKAALSYGVDLSEIFLEETRNPSPLRHTEAPEGRNDFHERQAQALKHYAQMKKEEGMEVLTSYLSPSTPSYLAFYATWLLCQTELFNERGKDVVCETILNQLRSGIRSLPLAALFFLAEDHPETFPLIGRCLSDHEFSLEEFLKSMRNDVGFPKRNTKPRLDYDSFYEEIVTYSMEGLLLSGESLVTLLRNWGDNQIMNNNVELIFNYLCTHRTDVVQSQLTKYMRYPNLYHKIDVPIVGIAGIPLSPPDGSSLLQ